ncbi:hypothetical protein O181_058994 [Austropuccinia psidii MF-1]|uniref:Uncharacterized protein n=1 Tax=Austropuccinia psidii MF-1 TaxID=1389203 RepID=A0A9Q3HY71_9BASI|nr:hypothetical protein [Austropuccinia psidii MF-1]
MEEGTGHGGRVKSSKSKAMNEYPDEESQIPGELEHAVKFRCNHSCTPDEIQNTLQDVRKRTNIGKYPPYESSHQGESRVNRWQLTSCQANVKQDKSQAHVKQQSSKRQAHVLLLSYTKSCDNHQYWFPCAFNSDSSPPDHPPTVQWLVKFTQDLPVCTNTHQRCPSASLDVGGGFDFTRSSMKGLLLSGIVVLKMTLVEPAAQYRG